ncbi:MAG: GNAT family N-acetyltransferase [Dysgonomonas sp.]
MEVLESKRIYMRNFIASDVDAIFLYRSLEEVAQYQYWYPYTIEQILEFVNQNKDSDLNILNKWNGFAIINKENNTLIGDCALKIIGDSAEIGCNISPVYQNRGFAKESLQLLITTCFKMNGIGMVYGITDSKNTPSIQLMTALGMIKSLDFEEKIICKDIPSTEYKYYIRKEKA